MRVTLTQDQMEYLQSIGIGGEIKPANPTPVMGPAGAGKLEGLRSAGFGWGRKLGRLLVGILVLGFLAWALRVHGEEGAPSGTPSAPIPPVTHPLIAGQPTAEGTHTESGARIPANPCPTPVSESGKAGQKSQEPSRGSSGTEQTAGAESKEPVKTDKDPEVFGQARGRNPSDATEFPSVPEDTVLAGPVPEVVSLFGEAEQSGEAPLADKPTPSRLGPTVAGPNHEDSRTPASFLGKRLDSPLFTLLLGMVAASLASAVVSAALCNRQVRSTLRGYLGDQAREQVTGGEGVLRDDQEPTGGTVPQPVSESWLTKEPRDIARSATEAPKMGGTSVKPRTVRNAHIPDPSEQLARMLRWASQSQRIRVKPHDATGPWHLGVACVTGPVRSRNEDYALCFTVNGHDVIVVADGCGGMDHGQYASCVAASAAAAHLMILYGREPKCVPEPLAGAASAVRAASCQLAVEADKIGISDFSGGMRTTLIVIVASRTDVGYAYIGDGGACVVRTSGEIVSFLEPQKADGMANVLAGSLGPDIQGHPITGCFPRRAGDLVLAGTDGVFDRVQEMFPADVVRLAAEKRGDLTQVAQAILSELATAKDNLGYICDDNMTLALLGDGRGQVAV